MRKLFTRSFQGRLFASFLLVGLVPFLICSIALVQVFRLRLSENARQRDQEMLQCVSDALDSVFDAYDQAVSAVQASQVIRRAMAGEEVADAQVYAALYAAVDAAQGYAHFDLCDGEGVRRYSTCQQPGDEAFSVNWGALYAAGQTGVLRFTPVRT